MLTFADAVHTNGLRSHRMIDRRDFRFMWYLSMLLGGS